MLGNGSQDGTPLTSTAGKLEVVVRAGAVAQQELEFIGENPSAASQHTIAGDAVPDLVQHRHHADGLHTLAQFHGVEAAAVVLQIHVRLVGKQVHCTVHIHLQSRQYHSFVLNLPGSNLSGRLMEALQVGVKNISVNEYGTIKALDSTGIAGEFKQFLVRQTVHDFRLLIP